VSCRTKRIYAAFVGTHFFLITLVCCRGIFWLIAQHLTILPSTLDKYGREGEVVAAFALGKGLAVSNPIRRGLATYLHSAGSQSGYGFFAPNIPSHHKLTFDLYYEDGRVEREVPHGSGSAFELRLASLLDRLAEPEYEPLREVVIKMLAFSNWRRHPDVERIRAIFGSVNVPSIDDFQHGKRESFEPLFSFDFSLRNEANP
jgi:hypothetical protein